MEHLYLLNVFCIFFSTWIAVTSQTAIGFWLNTAAVALNVFAVCYHFTA
jgi:hypothetical protein